MTISLSLLAIILVLEHIEVISEIVVFILVSLIHPWSAGRSHVERVNPRVTVCVGRYTILRFSISLLRRSVF